MSTATVWVAAAAFWLGCLVPGPWPLIAGAGAVPVARLSRRPGLRLLLVGLALVAAGSGSAGSRLALLSSGPLAERARAGGEAHLTAAVVTDARPSIAGAWLLVRVLTIDGARSGRRALLRIDDAEDAPALGSRLAFPATARPLGDEPFEQYLRRLSVGVEVYPVGPVDVVRGPPAVIAHTTALRGRVRAMASAYLPGDHAALLSGLVTGDTTGLSETSSDALRAAGLTHLVAVSGSNVALVLGGTMALAALSGLGARGRRRFVVVALVWFVVLVRAEPSVLRASVMALLVLASTGLGRGRDARHVLGAATLLLLVVDPLLAGQLGFALSVLATAGVLVVGPYVVERVPGPRPLAVVIGATVGAQVAVAPVLISAEGGMSVGAIPANLIAVPAAAVASAVGVGAALGAQILPPVGAAVAVLAYPALASILWAGRVFSAAPAVMPAHLLSPAAGAIMIALLFRRRRPAVSVAALAVVAVAVVRPWGGAPDVTSLTLTALDVGQGDALLVEVPSRTGAPARMLVDGGPDQQLALKLLRDRGVTALDAVAVSHPDADHTEGLPAVLARMPAGALVVGPDPPAELDEPAASALAVEAIAAQRALPVLRVAAGQQFPLGDATVSILSPPADGSLGDETNENSLVLRIDHGQDSILLTGDAEEAAQSRLLRRPDLLRAGVLKVPHHGGNTNVPGFLDAVGASTAVVSVGTGNDYGHPDPDVLADLDGVRVLRTDADGTVSVTID